VTLRCEAIRRLVELGFKSTRNRSNRLSRIILSVLIAVFFSNFVLSLNTAFSGISPEHKEAAQKRQAEIARQMFCNEKAAKEKVMKRDLASFVIECMDAIERAEQAIKK
jgi:hypothetical protein